MAVCYNFWTELAVLGLSVSIMQLNAGQRTIPEALCKHPGGAITQ